MGGGLNASVAMHSQPHSRHVGALRGKIESLVLAPFFIGLTAGHTEPPIFHRSSRVATGGRQHCVLFQWKPQFGKSEEHRTGAQCEILMIENKIKIELTLAGRPEVRRQTTPASERHQRVDASGTHSLVRHLLNTFVILLTPIDIVREHHPEFTGEDLSKHGKDDPRASSYTSIPAKAGVCLRRRLWSSTRWCGHVSKTPEGVILHGSMSPRCAAHKYFKMIRPQGLAQTI